MKYHVLKHLLLLFVIIGCSTTTHIQNKTAGSSPAEMPANQQPSDDAGMWLLPQLKGPVYAEMAAKGLNLPADSVYNLDTPSLNQAIIRVNIGNNGGGTGSFVSDKGLILTNHHIAYDAVASSSTAKYNLLKDGFYASHMRDEIPAKGYSLYIPIEQVEVTGKINNHIPDSLNYSEQQQYKQQAEKRLIAQRKGNNNDLVVEIDDYWSGNRQFMSVYKMIRDVRVVYAPPSSIGKYGGDIDNWQWPRHTGDFSFLRAYVAPDGSSRSYNMNNVPFKPQKTLRINPEGLQPGDFTMVLGFPGFTYRHESSYAFQFYEKNRNNVLIQSFQAILDGLEYAADHDSQTAVENASDRATYANELKYYKGIQQGFKDYDIVNLKRKQEEKFSQWIRLDSSRMKKYGRVLSQLKQAYNIASQTGDLLYASLYTLNNSTMLQIASLYEPYSQHLAYPDSIAFDDSQKNKILKQHKSIIQSIDIDAQNITLEEMLEMLTTLPDGEVPLFLEKQFGDLQKDKLRQAIHQFLERQQKESVVYNPDKGRKFLDMPEEQAAQQPIDSLIKLYQELVDSFKFARTNYLTHLPYLRPAQKRYVEGMIKFKGDSTEYPDANFTLRMSRGHVEGYSPDDGVYYLPFTTFSGMLAKNTGKKPFDAPKALQDYSHHVLSDSMRPSRYYTSDKRLIVDFLSTNDITGGNSGSPVLNGDGEIVGVAFDGNIKGVVGDYFYDPKLNRTISVDIRYVLFIMETYSHAQRLLEEMHITHQTVQQPLRATG